LCSTNFVFSQADFKNMYSFWGLSCQRELSNSDYILLFSDKITKTDNLGVEIWSKEMMEGGVPLNVNIRLRCTQQTSDGGFIMTGTYSAAGTDDVVLIKTDNAGNVAWSKSYGGVGDDHGIWVEQTADGGYIISGTKDETTPLRFIEGDIYVIKTDATGNVQWENVWGLGGKSSAQNIKQTSDGGYILTGNTAPEDDALNRLYLIKLDNAGNISWESLYNISCNTGVASSGREVWEIPGGFIVGGFVGGDLVPLKSKALFLKVDLAGAINDVGAFEFTVGGGGPTDLGFASMDVTSTGEFVGTGGGYNDFGPLYILKADANLNMVWSRTYWSFAFSSATSVREHSDGGYSFTDGTSILLKTTDLGMIHCEVPNAVFQSVANGIIAPLPTVVQPNGLVNSLNIQTQAVNVVLNVMCPPIVINPVVNSTNVNCLGGNDGTATVVANGGTVPYSYDWQPGGAITPVVNNLIAGTYTVTVTDFIGATATATVTITEPATAVSVAIDPINPICAGDNVDLNAVANGGTPIYNYSWNTGALTSLTNVSPVINTNYVITVTDNNGCLANANIDVIVNPSPVVIFVSDINQGCESVCVNFTNQTVGTQSVIWDFGDGSPISNLDPLVNHCYNVAGNYDVNLTVTGNNGCTALAITNNMINVYSNPVAAFSSSPQNPTIADPTVNFTDMSQNAVSWDWVFGDPNGNTSNLQNPSFSYADTGTYQVQLVVTNAFGCTDTAFGSVIIVGEFSIFIPNTFTPNDDEMNQVFKPLARGIANYEFLIFNRWGEEIFRTTDLYIGWNGKRQNNLQGVPQGVYVYKITCTDVLGEDHHFIGQVNLIR